MNSNVVQFPVTLTDPQISLLQSIGATYLAVWHKQTYAFLPRLHEMLERQAKFFIRNVEGFRDNALLVRTKIESSGLSDIIENIKGLEDPEDVAEYLNAGEDVISSITTALSRKTGALKRVLIDVGALGVYDVSRDLTRYQDELAKLEKDQPARTRELEAHEGKLADLNASIKVLEAANLEALFAGSVPSSQQIKDAAAMIASGGVSVEAVENAIKQIGELIGNVLEGMRYSMILDQRRDLQKIISELNTTLREMDKKKGDTQNYCDRLGEYASLAEQREQWRAAFDKIVQQLVPVERQFAAYQITSLESLMAVQSSISDLHAFVRKVLDDFRAGH